MLGALALVLMMIINLHPKIFPTMKLLKTQIKNGDGMGWIIVIIRTFLMSDLYCSISYQISAATHFMETLWFIYF